MSFKRYALSGLVAIVFVLIVIAVSKYSGVLHGRSDTLTTQAPAPLSPDVDSVMRNFHFQENSDSASIDIVGKEAVLRGRKVMAFRSNVAKTTFFKNLKGSIRSKKRDITFVADSGEWNTTKNSPFTLEQNIHLEVDGKVIPVVKSALIHFDRRIVEAVGTARVVYLY
jgi:hypothetical protein